MYGEETYSEADPYGPTTLDEPTPSSALDLDRLVWDPVKTAWLWWRRSSCRRPARRGGTPTTG